MNILECHSHGDKRFSAFYARLASGHTIEDLYQYAKRDEKDKRYAKPKGQIPVNLLIGGELIPHTNQLRYLFYTMLWHVYVMENGDLFEFAASHDGFRDKFAHKGAVYTPRYNQPEYRMEYSDLGCNQAQSIAWLVGKQGYFCGDEPRLVTALNKYWQRYHPEDERYPIIYE